MNWQQVTACFYKGNLRYSVENDSQGLLNFSKNIWLDRYTFALLIYM